MSSSHIYHETHHNYRPQHHGNSNNNRDDKDVLSATGGRTRSLVRVKFTDESQLCEKPTIGHRHSKGDGGSPRRQWRASCCLVRDETQGSWTVEAEDLESYDWLKSQCIGLSLRLVREHLGAPLAFLRPHRGFVGDSNRLDSGASGRLATVLSGHSLDRQLWQLASRCNTNNTQQDMQDRQTSRLFGGIRSTTTTTHRIGGQVAGYEGPGVEILQLVASRVAATSWPRQAMMHEGDEPQPSPSRDMSNRANSATGETIDKSMSSSNHRKFELELNMKSEMKEQEQDTREPNPPRYGHRAGAEIDERQIPTTATPTMTPTATATPTSTSPPTVTATLDDSSAFDNANNTMADATEYEPRGSNVDTTGARGFVHSSPSPASMSASMSLANHRQRITLAKAKSASSLDDATITNDGFVLALVVLDRELNRLYVNLQLNRLVRLPAQLTQPASPSCLWAWLEAADTSRGDSGLLEALRAKLGLSSISPVGDLRYLNAYRSLTRHRKYATKLQLHVTFNIHYATQLESESSFVSKLFGTNNLCVKYKLLMVSLPEAPDASAKYTGGRARDRWLARRIELEDGQTNHDSLESHHTMPAMATDERDDETDAYVTADVRSNTHLAGELANTARTATSTSTSTSTPMSASTSRQATLGAQDRDHDIDKPELQRLARDDRDRKFSTRRLSALASGEWPLSRHSSESLCLVEGSSVSSLPNRAGHFHLQCCERAAVELSRSLGSGVGGRGRPLSAARSIASRDASLTMTTARGNSVVRDHHVGEPVLIDGRGFTGIASANRDGNGNVNVIDRKVDDLNGTHKSPIATDRRGSSTLISDSQQQLSPSRHLASFASLSSSSTRLVESLRHQNSVRPNHDAANHNNDVDGDNNNNTVINSFIDPSNCDVNDSSTTSTTSPMRIDMDMDDIEPDMVAQLDHHWQLLLVMQFYSTRLYSDKPLGFAHVTMPLRAGVGAFGRQVPIVRPEMASMADRIRYMFSGETPIATQSIAAPKAGRYLQLSKQTGFVTLDFEISRQLV